MPVRTLKLAEFGAFQKAELEFADGLNVFVGANGTGKTHVMKLLYSMLETARAASGKAFEHALPTKLAGVFRPDHGEIRRLVRRVRGQNTAHVSMIATGTIQAFRAQRSEKSVTRFALHTKQDAFNAASDGLHPVAPSIFLPTREVLAMFEGFIHAYKERELSFDETYLDACIALSGGGLRGTRRETAERLVTALREALGGHVELSGPRFYVKFHGDRARMEAHLVAEGLRKIASLERLVLNGSLTKNGHLFWDEPEANLNPKLVTVVASVLAELARAGIQIFLTTHDYLLARRLSLSARDKKFPTTRFFGFYRPRPGAPVEVASARELGDLPDNPMLDEFVKLYDLELQSDGPE